MEEEARSDQHAFVQGPTKSWCNCVKRASVVMSLVLASFANALAAQTETADAIRQSILATWQLLSLIGDVVPADHQSDGMGAQRSGYINAGPDGVIVVITGSNRNKPVGAVPSPSAAKTFVKSMISDAGTDAFETQAHSAS